MPDDERDKRPPGKSELSSGSVNQSDSDEREQEPRPRAVELVEHFSAMMQVGPRPNPFIEKLDTDQLGKIIEHTEAQNKRDHTSETKRENSRRYYVGIGAVIIFALCWLFLAYDKSDHIDAIISAVVGLLGGFGLGRASIGSSDA